MYIRQSAAALCLFLACGAAAPSVAQDTVSVLAGSCESCHGAEGRSQGVVPSLAGSSYEALAARLAEFKSDDDGSATIMARIAAGYSDEELRILARYFADLKREDEP